LCLLPGQLAEAGHTRRHVSILGGTFRNAPGH
jgi:hypothetical protein